MYIAKFEKVSEKQFLNDLNNIECANNDAYSNIQIPKRATKGSAGYDFYSPITVTLKPNQSIKIPTGIRCKIEDGYVLSLYPRSSLGFKYQMSLLNTVGIIDADYYNADNEGHIIVGIINRGDSELVINSGDRFVQGIFTKFFLAEEADNNIERHGGFGSTN